MTDAAIEQACTQARAAMLSAREQCLAAIGNTYGHPACATPVDVLAAVNTLLRVAFDAGSEHGRASSVPPPPAPDDAEVVTAAEALVRALRRG